MEFAFLVDGVPLRIALDVRDGKIVFNEGGHAGEAEVRRVSPSEVLITSGGHTSRLHIARDGDRTFVSVDGREFLIVEPPPETAGSAGADDRTPEGSLRVRAPMPGKVIKLDVREGQKVRRNQTLAVVEAMKMENEIQSPAEGTVRTIHVSVGELVDSEKPLMEIETDQ